LVTGGTSTTPFGKGAGAEEVAEGVEVAEGAKVVVAGVEAEFGTAAGRGRRV